MQCTCKNDKLTTFLDDFLSAVIIENYLYTVCGGVPGHTMLECNSLCIIYTIKYNQILKRENIIHYDDDERKWTRKKL